MQNIATSWPVFGLVLISLVLFGCGYNALTKWLERNKFERGFVSLLVAGGAAVTVLAAGFLIGFEQSLIVLACFAASGLPMMVGSVARYIADRAADEKTARLETKGMLDESPSRTRQE